MSGPPAHVRMGIARPAGAARRKGRKTLNGVCLYPTGLTANEARCIVRPIKGGVVLQVRQGRPKRGEGPQALVSVNVRLPVELAESLHRKSLATGELKSEILRRALARELEVDGE